ncbi:MAG TPA: AraC family transcriptional regulator [Puia sp.]|nr:AraC family transcriptional regulator [Puia sp.]
MKFTFFDKNGVKILFLEDSEGFPEWKGEIFKGSTIFKASGDFGKIMFQQIITSELVIWNSIYHMKQPEILRFRHEGPLLLVHLSLINHLDYKTGALGKIELNQGQFVLYYVPTFEGEMTFLPGKDYITFGFSFSPDFFETALLPFPALSDFLKKIQQEHAISLFPKPRWLTMRSQKIIAEIRAFPYGTDLLQPSYLDNKIKELLFHLLVQGTTEEADPVPYSRQDVDSLHWVKNSIAKNYHQHLTIREFAREIAMNETKLKKGFMQVFNIGVYGYLEHIRMEKAAELLLLTDKTVQMISIEVGYRYPGNFIKAFKNWHKLTPKDFKKSTRA